MKVKATRDTKGRFVKGCQSLRFKGGSLSWNGYRLVSIGGKQFREHRVLWEQAYGPIPPGKILHHKNGIKTDNKLENLELVTREEHPRIHFSKPKHPCLVCHRPAKAHGLCVGHCKEVKRHGRVLTESEHTFNRSVSKKASVFRDLDDRPLSWRRAAYYLAMTAPALQNQFRLSGVYP